MTEPAHYDRGPSGASRWLICTDSPEAQAPYPDETSDAADEGTAAHWLLEQCLNSGDNCQDWVDRNPETRGADGYAYVWAGEETGCLKDWLITGEMVEAVQVAIDTVNEQAKKRGTRLMVEERVMIPDHYGLQHKVGGTADIIMYLPKSKTLYVLDFKYGKGHVVEVTGGTGNIYEHDPETNQWKVVKGPDWGINPQIGLYAIAAIGQLERLIKKKAEVKWVIAGVIQPRAYHKKGAVRTKKITPFQLMDLEMALIQAVNGPKVRVAGDHCDPFCRARPDCQAYHDWRSGRATDGFEGENPLASPELDKAFSDTLRYGTGHVLVDGEAATHVPRQDVVSTNQPEVPALQDMGSFLSRPVKGLTLKELAVARRALPSIKAWAKEVEEEVRTRLLNDLQVPGTRLAQGPGSRAYGGSPDEVWHAAVHTADQLQLPNVDELYEPAQLKSPAQLEKLLGKAKFTNTPLAALVTTKAGGPIVVDEDSDKPDYVKDGGFEAEEKPVESSLL